MTRNSGAEDPAAVCNTGFLFELPIRPLFPFGHCGL
jgi:hypothetical protein